MCEKSKTLNDRLKMINENEKQLYCVLKRYKEKEDT